MTTLHWTTLHRTGALIVTAIFATAPIGQSKAETIAADELLLAPSWSPAKVEDVRDQVQAWLADQSLEPVTKSRIEMLWPVNEMSVAPEQLVSRIVKTYSLVQPKVQPLVDLCNRPFSEVTPPQLDSLAGEEVPKLFRNQLKLFYASWLARSDFHDECLQALAGLEAQDVVDPASLLFYRAVAHHRLVQPEPCLEALSQLLEREQELPERFQQMARLMQLDIHDLENDSLSHIARRMSDIQRRLDLGRAGKHVRKVEDDVIESLDKLIKEIEKKQQQQSASAGGSSAPSEPMQDSQLGRAQGAGKVKKKFIGSQSVWGNLPPKQREEALQQIGREFPSHYREVIEQYFKRLASEDVEPRE